MTNSLTPLCAVQLDEERAPMKDQNYMFSYDIGTTGNKTCLYRIGPKLELVDSCVAEYPLRILPNGGAEQNVVDRRGVLVWSVKE